MQPALNLELHVQVRKTLLFSILSAEEMTVPFSAAIKTALDNFVFLMHFLQSLQDDFN